MKKVKRTKKADLLDRISSGEFSELSELTFEQLSCLNSHQWAPGECVMVLRALVTKPEDIEHEMIVRQHIAGAFDNFGPVNRLTTILK